LRLGVIHAIAVLSGAIPGIAAGVLANALLARSSHRRLYQLGTLLLVTAAIDATIYAVHTASGGNPPLLLPLLQRIALCLLLVWMAAIAVTMLRRPGVR